MKKLYHLLGRHAGLLLLLSVLCFLQPKIQAQPIWNGATATNWTGSGNTELDPYLITTAEQLAGIAAEVKGGNDFSGKFIKLANDLFMSNLNDEHENKPQWTPIGEIVYEIIEDWNWTVDTAVFRGTFDGGGYSIHDVYYSAAPDYGNWDDPFDPGGLDFTGWYKGFFGYIDGATIKNLHLEDIVMVGAADMGGLVCINNGGTIINCSVTGIVMSASDETGGQAGGIAGSNYGIIEDCYSAADVKAVRGAGSFVGRNYSNGEIRNSHASGIAHTSQYYAGGFAGVNFGYIENCYATGMAKANYYYYAIGTAHAAGFVSANGNGGIITNCYATGDVNTPLSGAGFAGGNNGGATITNCYATGNVTAGQNAHLFVGQNGSGNGTLYDPEVPATMVNCFATGTTINNGGYPDWAEGFAGVSPSFVMNCYYNSETYMERGRTSGADFRTTAQMQSQAFVDTLNMFSAMFGLTTWEYIPEQYPQPTGTIATNLTDYLAGGNGSESDPYRINTKTHLENFATYVNKGYLFKDKYVKLETDIALNAPQSQWGITAPTQWKTIGFEYTATFGSGFQFAFAGTFDGGGHEISNLYIDNLNNNQGFFGTLRGGATVKNLGIVDVWLKGGSNIGILAGTVVGNPLYPNITVIQCWTSGDLLARQGHEGGMIGFANADYSQIIIKNCYSTANLGIEHIAFSSGNSDIIENVYFAGTNQSVAGYLCNGTASIFNFFYDSETTGRNSSYGGGMGTEKTTAEMQSKDFVNILNYWVTINNEQGEEQYLYWQHNVDEYPTFTTTIPPHSVIWNTNGGNEIPTQLVLDASRIVPPPAPEKTNYTFAGWYADAELTALFNFDTTLITENKTLYAKWLQKDNPADDSWFNPFADTYIIYTKEQLAGLALRVNGSWGTQTAVVNDFAGKTVKLGNDILLNDTADWKYWGIYAFANHWTPIGNADNRRFRGTFDGDGYKISGMYINHAAPDGADGKGLFGYTGTGSEIKNAGITASYVRSVGSDIGGLVGNTDGIITECYSETNVVADGYYGSNVGGLAGRSNGQISNCYATGKVTGKTNVGGLVGRRDGGSVTNSYATGKVTGTESVGGLQGYGGTASNSYYDRETTGQNDTGKGTPKTTAEMKQKATFVNWDFDEIWGRNNAINNGYPYLRWSMDGFIEDDEDAKATVTFNSNGGNNIPPQEVTIGLTAVAPATPIRENYGDVDKIQATTLFNLQIFIFLLHFRVMSKKFVFSVVAKSQRKMVFV